MQLKDKIALVFGGTGGIGSAICNSLLENGTSVCFTDINTNEGAKLAEMWAVKYGEEMSCFLHVDVSNTTSVEEAFQHVAKKWSRAPDIVVNCVGIINEFDFEKCIDVNLTGMLRTLTAAQKYMGTDSGNAGGCFVALSSAAAIGTYPPVPVYSATKSAIVTLAKVYGTEAHFSRTGVRVNALLPGTVNTPLLQYFTPEFCYKKAENKPNPDKTLQPDEIAKSALDVLKDDTMNGKSVLITTAGGSEIVKFDQDAKVLAKTL